MNRNNIITGQIVLRDSTDNTPNGDDTNRKMMMVVGVIAVPKGLKLKGECKYTICSKSQQNDVEGLYQMIDPDFKKISQSSDEIALILFPETEEDVSDKTIGMGLSGILKSIEMWRV